MKDRYDVVIVGGGPAGLSAAVNVLARGRTPLVLKAGESNLEKAEKVNNYLGFMDISGKDMQEKFMEHAISMGAAVIKSKVSNVMPFNGQFMLNIDGNVVAAEAVILATGAGRTGEIPGEKTLLGRGVSYCATCDGMLFRGKKAAVSGNSANLLDEADFLRAAGVDVTIINKKEYDAKETHGIPFIQDEIEEILPGAFGTVGELKLKSGKNIKSDGVFLLRNTISPEALISGIGMEKGRITVDCSMRTNIEGIFACGDCAVQPLQVSNAVGTGLIAGQNAAKYVDKINRK